jgi:hypothetical protein
MIDDIEDQPVYYEHRNCDEPEYSTRGNPIKVQILMFCVGCFTLMFACMVALGNTAPALFLIYAVLAMWMGMVGFVGVLCLK